MMKTVATVAALALATLTLTSTAFADPSTALGMAADAAPQTDDDLSHVNGRLVPVGSRNEYLLTHKSANLAFDPLTLMVGWIDVEAQFAISDHVAISASFATMKVDTTRSPPRTARSRPRPAPAPAARTSPAPVR